MNDLAVHQRPLAPSVWATQSPMRAHMVETCESRIPPSPTLDKVTVSFEKLSNTDVKSSIESPQFRTSEVYRNKSKYFLGVVSLFL